MELDDKNIENKIENSKTKNDKRTYRNNMYQALLEFFKADMNIKNEMIKLKPTSIDDYNEESIIEYKDKLYNFFKETKREFNNITQKFNLGSEVQNAIDMYFNKLDEQFLNSSNKYGICQDLYLKQVSDMNEKFIEEVKDKCYGYSLKREENLADLINKTKTINELLHVIHSYIVNNDEILQAMPIIATKENEDEYPITLYGETTEASSKLYENFPLDMNCGVTDIISMKDKILMMVRDRGHALTIEVDDIDKESDNLIKYFLPKICNLEMVKNLPGVNKITKAGATGMFISKKGELIETLFEFIEKVPTDADMILDTSKPKILYNEFGEAVYNMEDEIFSENDAKEIAMEEGENGRRVGKLARLQENIKKVMKNVKKPRNQSINKQNSEQGDNDDRGTRD